MTTLACSKCFNDHGLYLDAQKIGRLNEEICPQCKNISGAKLDFNSLQELAYRFFVQGALTKTLYGAAPYVQFNDVQKTSIVMPSDLMADVLIFESTLGIGFFYYGPRLWMVGEVEPLKALQDPSTRDIVIQRILSSYPTRTVLPDEMFYRVRKSPSKTSNPLEYDSPPRGFSGGGRLDVAGESTMYASPDLEVCVHECRFVAEDDLYVATLCPQRPLRLLDLTEIPDEEDVTEFEGLDIAVHMLFLAGKHSYEITQALSVTIRGAGYDGIVYPSYFSLLKLGMFPFETVYGLSLRRIERFKDYEKSKAIPNYAIFGHPIQDGRITVKCINRLRMKQVFYEFFFGPVE